MQVALQLTRILNNHNYAYSYECVETFTDF